MLTKMIQHFNWVDVLFIIILLRIAYIAIKKGVVVESFKLCGTLFALYISLHYYPVVSDWLRSLFGLKNVPLDFLDFVICFFLAGLGYIVFVAIRAVFTSFIKMEPSQRLNKLCGLLLGGARIILCTSLVAFVLSVSTITYLVRSVRYSYFGSGLFYRAINTYTWIWGHITSKFMLDEEFNKSLSEVKGRFLQK